MCEGGRNEGEKVGREIVGDGIKGLKQIRNMSWLLKGQILLKVWNVFGKGR